MRDDDDSSTSALLTEVLAIPCLSSASIWANVISFRNRENNKVTNTRSILMEPTKVQIQEVSFVVLLVVVV